MRDEARVTTEKGFRGLFLFIPHPSSLIPCQRAVVLHRVQTAHRVYLFRHIEECNQRAVSSGYRINNGCPRSAQDLPFSLRTFVRGRHP